MRSYQKRLEVGWCEEGIRSYQKRLEVGWCEGGK